MTQTINVLLVDEDTEVLELTKTFLEREDAGLAITTETDAQSALDSLDEGFDAVVSDYAMPSMTGAEFLESVHDRQPGLPFFFFTGKDIEEIEAVAEDADLAGYVQKGTGTDRYADLAADIRTAVED